MKYLLPLILLSISFIGITQQDEKPPIIFEGKVISATEFFIDSAGNADTNTAGDHGLQSVYTTNTSYLVKVKRVLKGHEYLDTGYVEIITKLGINTLNDQGKYENYIPKLHPGIFFSELNTVPVTLERETNNNVVIQPFQFRPMKIDLNRRGCYGLSSYDHNICYKTKEDLTKFLKEEYDIDYISSSEKESSSKKKSVSSKDGLVKKNDYQTNVDNYNAFIQNSKHKRNTQQTPVNKSSNSLHLEFANETMTDSANLRSFEFDILTSSDESVYFDNCLIRLSFNSSSFGNDLVQNEKIEITKGTPFNSNTYINPDDNVIDESSNVLGIPFGTDFNINTLNRTMLNSSPQQLLHVKIIINQCNSSADINFSDISFTPDFSFYSSAPDAEITDVHAYDNTTYGSGIKDELCKPIITDFTQSVATGIGDSITIKGKYFGASRYTNTDTAEVQFRDANVDLANSSNSYMERLDSIDYLFWSDTEIRVSATSFISTENSAGIGSGKFIVKNKWGDTTKSISELFVEYAIKNYGQSYSDKYMKKRGNLIYDTAGYVFSLDSEITNNPTRKAVTEKAIKDWACQTGVNFKINYNDSIQNTNSSIWFNNNNTNPPDIIAYANPSVVTSCFQNEETRHEIFVDGIEIEMNSDTDWDYDTLGNISSSKTSYYSVLIHELGHAHQLEHVLNNQNELMRPTIATGQYRTFSPNLFAGADDVKTFTQNNLYNNCDYSPMIFGFPDCSTNSVIESKYDNSLLIYPNPTSNRLTIELPSNTQGSIKLYIYDNIGQVVLTSKENSNQNMITLDVHDLKKGSYILKTVTGNKVSSNKFIKTE